MEAYRRIPHGIDFIRIFEALIALTIIAMLVFIIFLDYQYNESYSHFISSVKMKLRLLGHL